MRRNRARRAAAAAIGVATMGVSFAGWAQPVAALSSHDVGCSTSSGRSAFVRVWWKYDHGMQEIQNQTIYSTRGTINRTEFRVWYQPDEWVRPGLYDFINLRTHEENVPQGSTLGVTPSLGGSPYSHYDNVNPLYKYDFHFTDGTICATAATNSEKSVKL